MPFKHLVDALSDVVAQQFVVILMNNMKWFRLFKVKQLPYLLYILGEYILQFGSNKTLVG